MTTLATAQPHPPAGGAPAGRRPGAARLVPPGLWWVLPGFVVSVGLIYYSIVYSGYLSLFQWRGGRSPMEPVGLENYRQVLADPVFWRAVRNTTAYFLVVFSVQVVCGVTFAAAMHSRIRWANLYKVIMVIPVVVAPATMAPAHIELWQTNGAVNDILRALGLGGLTAPWIGQASTSLLVIILVGCWASVGFGFILYFGAMTQIDLEMLEAGRIDGASNLRILFSLVLPNVRATTISLGILNLITALKLFDNVWLLTQGGPANSSQFLGTMIYSETSGTDRDLGRAAALSIVLMVVAVTTSVVLQLRSRERRVRTITEAPRV